MRLVFGIILGCALTVGGAYVADNTRSSATDARPMVNWDVVARNAGSLSGLVRDSWKKITG
jgi:hypothetical protein